jgi:predicted flap endonuclease-1-like 5' DNA nuclease
MLYLAIQTFMLLAITAVVFFGLGYAFKRKGSQARVEELSPADMAQSSNEGFERTILDLRTRLLEKERDLAELLANTPAHDSLSSLEAESRMLRDANRNLEEKRLALEQRCIGLEEKLAVVQSSDASLVPPKELSNEAESLHAEIHWKNARIEQFQSELEAQKRELDAVSTQWLTLQSETNSLQNEWEVKWSSLEAEFLSSKAALEVAESHLDGLRADFELKQAEAAASLERVKLLEEQLRERDYLLQISQSTEEETVREVGAIWADVAPSIEEPEWAPAPEVDQKLQALQTRSDQIEREFRERIRHIESSLKNLRIENERALVARLDLSKRPSDRNTVRWEPDPGVVATQTRDELVDALWQIETDAEKQSLSRSVESLQRALEEKEKSIEALDSQVQVLVGKVDPELLGPDNLQLIKGIGPYIRKMLQNEFGIETFEQVANLSPKVIEEVSEKLFFKNKIEKENWKGQAAALHHKKYGAADGFKRAA